MNLQVFDNKVPYTIRENLLDYCTRSSFRLGWTDRPPIENDKSIPNIYSSWSNNNLSESKILPYIAECMDETPFFTCRHIESIILNLIRPSDVHFIHSHPNKQVALYYCNLTWEDGWYGETMFYDPNDLEEVSFTSLYKPGRIILFDGSTPHAIRPQSVSGPKYRITLSIVFR